MPWWVTAFGCEPFGPMVGACGGSTTTLSDRMFWSWAHVWPREWRLSRRARCGTSTPSSYSFTLPLTTGPHSAAGLTAREHRTTLGLQVSRGRRWVDRHSGGRGACHRPLRPWSPHHPRATHDELDWLAVLSLRLGLQPPEGVGAVGFKNDP